MWWKSTDIIVIEAQALALITIKAMWEHLANVI